MDSSKMISEQLFLLIPMLYNQIIRPIEGALRAKISPLQFYALMALKREGCMTMSALSSLRRIQTAKHPSDQQPGGHRPGGTPAVQAGQEAYFHLLKRLWRGPDGQASGGGLPGN